MAGAIQEIESRIEKNFCYYEVYCLNLWGNKKINLANITYTACQIGISAKDKIEAREYNFK